MNRVLQLSHMYLMMTDCLQEVAAWLLYHRSPNKFEQVIERVKQEDQEELIETIAHNQLEDGLNDGYFLLVEIVMFF